MTDEGTNFPDLMKQQIDIALDLLVVAKDLHDDKWREALMTRLRRLSERLEKYNNRRKLSQRSA
jgi:hypothetical protein